MSLWSKIVNVVRWDRVNREIDEELEAHIEAAIEVGRDPAEARHALGSALRHREASLDVRVATWLHALRADAGFALRQLCKHKGTSAAAALSLGLAMGACLAAFRLIDAVWLRSLPIAHPETLYALAVWTVGSDGRLESTADACSYPIFREMRAAVAGEAELLALGYTDRMDVTYGGASEAEHVYQQYVSGGMFQAFGVRPALGRVFTEADDRVPGAPAHVVLSYEYWTRRFGRDPSVIGRTFRKFPTTLEWIERRSVVWEIIGVAEKGFTGVEPGAMVDVFLPAMMSRAVERAAWTWFRTYARLKPGIAPEPVCAKLEAVFRASYEESLKKSLARSDAGRAAGARRLLSRRYSLEPAFGGVSSLQKEYRPALATLGALVGLVLVIACVNVANLLLAQGASRSREMALRVALGAGRARLVQLVLVEAACLAVLSSTVGALVASSAAPFIVAALRPADNPARFLLPVDWRLAACSVAIVVAATCLLGSAAAWRAAKVQPYAVVVGANGRQSGSRVMNALTALQVAFCFAVVFVGGLLLTTFWRLTHQPTGFSAERILTVDAFVPGGGAKPVAWHQVAEQLRALPGVEKVALAGWPLLTGTHWGDFIAVEGSPEDRLPVYFINVSSGWIDLVKIPLLAGRDFDRAEPSLRVGIVNQAFARRLLGVENPIGKSLENSFGTRMEIVGLVGDTRPSRVRDPIPPVVYVPFVGLQANPEIVVEGTFVLRTSVPDPLSLAETVRREVARVGRDFRVINVRSQEQVNRANTVRERLLALLALFFAAVALALAGVGLYGVLSYSVLARRREIGIRLAIGASAGHVVRSVVARALAMVLVGGTVGLVLGRLAGRYIETLLYGVKPSDLAALALPVIAVIAAAILAALAPVLRAVRIDPAVTLRSE
jgi:predicted permease